MNNLDRMLSRSSDYSFVVTCIALTAILSSNHCIAQTVAQQTSDLNDWEFIDNGQLKVGVKRASGAAIGWMSVSGS